MTATQATPLDNQRLAVLLEGGVDPTSGLRIEILDGNHGTRPLVAAKAWELDLADGRIRIESSKPDFLESMNDVLTRLGATAADAREVATRDDPVPASGMVAVMDAEELVATLETAGPDRSEMHQENDGSGGLLSLGMLRDVPLEVSAELGRTRLSVSEVLQLRVGSIIELDRAAGAPVDVIVNGASIAKGEVVVIDEEYGVRITDIIGRVSDTLQ